MSLENLLWRVGICGAFATSLMGCAASKSGAAPASPPAQEPSPKAPAAAPAADMAQPGAQYAQPPPASRELSISQASNDVDVSQRELDVAGGDCRNACRALGSMDRAAGRICALAQAEDEIHRCEDAKTRVYSARDRVRGTCGSCPDVTVERSAPIPSR